MRYLVQSGNIGLSAVIVGQCAGCAFLSQNLLRTGAGDASAAFPDNSLRGGSQPIMPADTQSEYPITA